MVKKNEKNELNLRKRVYSLIDLHPEMTSASIVEHFKLEGYTRSTLYDILKRKEKNIGVNRRVGSGRPAKKMTKCKVKRLAEHVNNSHGTSQRKLARKYNVHHSYIFKILKTKTDIRYRKKIKVPKRSDQQKQAVSKKCRKLTKLFRNKEVVIDDESYFRLNNSELSGNSGFYTSDITQTPDNVKLKRVAKFDQKLLVWVAISPSGMSDHYIVPSGQAVNTKVYIEECLEARLVPYINSLQNTGEVIFWPDLASAHYSKNTLSFLYENNIEVVPKEFNPANTPEVRPIEDFWAEIKRLVYDGCWEAKDLRELKNRINWAFRKIDKEKVRKLGLASFERVRKVGQFGLENL